MHHWEPLGDLSGCGLAVSFGYRHILRPEVLATARRPVVNLHISWLPYNRGAHPDFWSRIEGPPAGVTIHEIDAGTDTSDIIARRKLGFGPEGLTLRETHARLMALVEALFIETALLLLSGDYQSTPQSGAGPCHHMSALPPWMTDWDMKITNAIAGYTETA